MKDTYHHISLVKLCRLFGVTPQAYYQQARRSEEKSIESHLVVQEVLEIRKFHRRMGGRKLYEKLEPFLLEHQIKMGRDALFDLLAVNGLLVRKSRSRIYTTNSFHWLRKYPNLIRELKLSRKNELWVSDITYWKPQNEPYYISFITDAYSKKIVGYHIAQNLEAIASIQALNMALESLPQKSKRPESLIHHSDRGIQYCSKGYVKLLQDNDVTISMTENGDPLENAIAERINGIIKNEYLIDYEVDNFLEAQSLLKSVVELYNDDRPHLSLGMLTPNTVHNNNIKPEKLWKNYYQKKPDLVNPLQD